MRNYLSFMIIFIALTACSIPLIQVPTSNPVKDIPQSDMPNPASVYCTQQGNQLEIRTAADGSQSGVCVFSDGSTCDEWAYFRGECSPDAQISSTPIISIEITQKAGNEGAGENASGGYMPPGTTEEISDWWGVIRSTPPDAQFDDYFERQDLGQVFTFGIDSLNPTVRPQIEALRDSGKIVHLFGKLLSNVPDVNGSQVQVERIEIEE